MKKNKLEILENEIKSLKLENEKLESENSTLAFENNLLLTQLENVKLLTETINESFWLLDSKTHEIIYINPAFKKMFDKSVGNIVVDKYVWLEKVHPRDREYVRREFLNKAINGTYDTEYRIVHSSGKIHWVRDRTFPMKNSDTDKIARLTEFITHKKMSDKRMLESKNNLNIIMENTSVGLLIFNNKFKPLFANQTIGKMLGYSLKELSNLNPHDVIAPNYLNLVLERFQSRFKGNEIPSTYEIDLIKKDNSIINVEIISSIVQYNGVQCNLVTITDITNFKKLFNKVTKDRNYINAIIESSKDIYVISVNKNLTINVINKNAQKLFEKINKHKISSGDKICNPFNTSKFCTDLHQSIKDVIDGQEIENIKKVLIDGKYFYFEAKYSPINDDDGKIDSVAIFIKDITEMISTQEKLKEINENKDKFFSILAHDLKSPIGAFSTLIDLVLKEEIKDKYILEILEELSKSSKTIKELLDNLLEWSYTMRGDFRINFQPYHIYYLFNDIKLLFKHPLEKKSINLINKIPSNIIINIDVNTVRAVFRNIIHNAIKYSNKNSDIKVYSILENNLIKIIIEDFGIGMEQNRIDDLFKIDKMSSIEGTNSEIGSGLGLILCKEYMEKNNGTIEVSSLPNIGSKFILSFPFS